MSVGLSVKAMKLARDAQAQLAHKANKITPLSQGRLYTDFSDFIRWVGDVTQTSERVITGDTSLRIATDSSNPSSAARLQNAGLNLSSIKTLMLRLYIDNYDLLSYVRVRFHKDTNNYANWEARR